MGDAVLEEVTFDVVGCARCRGDGHPRTTFRVLRYPVEIPGGPTLTHWAPCPTTGEPILMSFGAEPTA